MEKYELEREVGLALANRAYVYNLMHVAFGFQPSAAVLETVCGAEVREVLKAFAVELGRSDSLWNKARESVDAAGLQGRLDGLCALGEEVASRIEEAPFVEALRSDFTKLFQVPGEAYVRPWESPYLGKEGMVFQASTLDVRSFYHQAGFKLKAEKHFPDDHIAAMMDYMGRMAQRAYEAFANESDDQVRTLLAAQRLFAEKHLLTWVDEFAKAVAEKDERGYFNAFAQAAVAFVHVDYELAADIDRSLVKM